MNNDFPDEKVKSLANNDYETGNEEQMGRI
jgi:hypothetical protein